MRSKNKALVFFFAMVLLLGLSVTAPLPALADKIAVVNVDRAVQQCEEGKRAKAKVRQRVEKIRANLKKHQDTLNRLKTEYSNTMVLLKPEAKAAKVREIQRLEDDLKVKTRDAEREVKYLNNDTFTPIARNMIKIIQEIGIKGQYDLVVPHKVALWAPKSNNITDQVIAAYNRAHP
jgi:outer membrane protein